MCNDVDAIEPFDDMGCLGEESLDFLFLKCFFVFDVVVWLHFQVVAPTPLLGPTSLLGSLQIVVCGKDIEHFVLDLQLGDTLARRRFGFGSDGRQQLTLKGDFSRLATLEQMHMDDAWHAEGGGRVDRLHATVRVWASQRLDDQLFRQVHIIRILGRTGRLGETIKSTVASADHARFVGRGPVVVRFTHGYLSFTSAMTACRTLA